jgi:hypothetical protein
MKININKTKIKIITKLFNETIRVKLLGLLVFIDIHSYNILKNNKFTSIALYN